MKICSSCGAKVPDGKIGVGPNGQPICCAACIFDPRGCRCRYGEFGVIETYRDPDFAPPGPDAVPGDFYEWADDELPDYEDHDRELWSDPDEAADLFDFSDEAD